MRRFYGLMFICCYLTVVNSLGQEITVTGTVRTVSGEPLPGANVVIKGTQNGSITDVDGAFSLVAPPNAILAVSFIGFNTTEVAVNNRTKVDVTLEESAQTLKDVVVIGYGMKERSDITTAISSVSGEDLKQMPVVSFDQALQGRAAGVQVTKNTGAPGGGVSIRIRGTASFLGGQEPLYIIDGVAMTNTATGSFAQPNTDGGANYAGNEIINGLAGLNMEDIESIDVLKDAASASIYGSRAANGVVIITTKRGKEGPPRVNFNTYYGVQQLGKRYELLDASQYAAMVNEAKIRQGQPIVYSEAPTNNTDWQDEIFQVAPMFNSNLSVSGGNKSTSYMVSFNYLKQDGIVLNSGFERYAFRTNLDQNISKSIKLGTSISVSQSQNQRLRNAGGANRFDAFNGNSTFGPSIISSALVANPMLPVRDEAGRFVQDSLSFYPNPVAQALAANLVSKPFLGIGNVYAEIQLLKSLKFRTSWSSSIRNETETFVFSAVPGLPGAGRIQFNTYNEQLWMSENFFTYNLPVREDLKVTVIGGFSVQEFRNRGLNVDITGVNNDAIIDVAAGTRVVPYNTGGDFWGMVSYFGRFEMSYKGKYLLEGTTRVDGSSRFGLNRQYGLFPAISAAWQLGEENFMKGQSVISDAKFRASVGVTGNDQIPPFGWRASAAPLNGIYIGYKPLIPVTIRNEDYSWETTTQTDVGLSFGLLNNRIQVTTDYYIKSSDGILAFVPIPNTTGFNTVMRNVGKMRNSGLEVALSSDLVDQGDFKWNSSFNISFNRNEVVSTFTGGDLVAGNWGYASVAREGQPISFQLFQVGGINSETGRIALKDINGSGGQDGGDIRIIASPLPDHFGGWNNVFRYKNFDANVFFQWSYGNYLINNTRAEIQGNGKPDLSTVGPNLSAEALGRWTRPGQTDATFPVIDYSNASGIGVPTDQNLEDGSYLRLKTLSVGYNIPSTHLSRFKIQNARVYFSSNNLLTLTRYSGFDPEVNANGGLGGISGNIAIGYDNGTYPQARTYVLGLSMNF